MMAVIQIGSTYPLYITSLKYSRDIALSWSPSESLGRDKLKLFPPLRPQDHPVLAFPDLIMLERSDVSGDLRPASAARTAAVRSKWKKGVSSGTMGDPSSWKLSSIASMSAAFEGSLICVRPPR